MSSNQPIRLAMIRCDSHAYWFAPFFGEVDPAVLSTYSNDAPTRQSIHYYGCAVGNYRQMAIEPVPGFVVTKLYDRVGDRDADNTDLEALQYGSYPGRANELSKTLLSHPQVCHTIDELLEDIDAVFIADSSSPKDGSDHLELVRPFLERGIPSFVDKPFASTFADAQEMVDLAKASNTPLMNASLLEHTDTGKGFRRRFDEIGEPGLLVVKGVGFGNAAVGHGARPVRSRRRIRRVHGGVPGAGENALESRRHGVLHRAPSSALRRRPPGDGHEHLQRLVPAHI
jgi:hypothetical protein